MGNNGSAILISLLTLVLLSIVILGVSNVYVNKIKSIKNINDYYDKKIIAALDKKQEKSSRSD